MWVASAPFPLLDVLGVWEQRPEAVLDGIVMTSILSLFLAPALLGLGLRRSNRDRQPWELRALDGRLAVAGLWIWTVGLLVFAIAFTMGLHHGLSF